MPTAPRAISRRQLLVPRSSAAKHGAKGRGTGFIPVASGTPIDAASSARSRAAPAGGSASAAPVRCCGPLNIAQWYRTAPRNRSAAKSPPGLALLLRRAPRLARDDHAAQGKPPPPAAGLADDVAKLEFAVGQLQQRRVAGRPDREMAEIVATQHPRRGGGAG